MANEYLKRTPTSTGNRRVWTWSGWIKKSEFDSNTFFGAQNSGGDYTFLFSNTNGTAGFQANIGQNITQKIIGNTSGNNRDYSSWYHVVFSVNTVQSVASVGFRIFVNGIERNYETLTYNEVGYLTSVNHLCTHAVGARYDGSAPFKGQLADVFLIDGQALTPDVFGFYKQGKGYISVGSTQATDFRPGQWVPKTPRVIKTEINRRGGFGVNGFYLPMNDSNNFGADFHCDPNSIITLNEKLPQPRVGVASTASVGLGYTDALRADPYAANLVLAIPGVIGGQGSGYGDYSANIKGSGSNKTVTAVGNAGVAVTASYYGSALTFDGSGDYLTIPASSDFNFGTGDFTAEFWVYSNPANSSAYRRWLTTTNGNFSSSTWVIREDGSADKSIGINAGRISASSAFQRGQWNHIAYVRFNNIESVYVNGVCVGISTSSYSYTEGGSNGLYIGGSSTEYLDGYLQDLRIYKGVAKYKGGFDVPKPYTPVGIATWRAVPDCTANNFATWNPISKGGYTGTELIFRDGNLSLNSDGATGDRTSYGTIGISTTSKCYFENYLINDGGTYMWYVGINDTFMYVLYNGTRFYLNGVYQDVISETNSTGDIFSVTFDGSTRQVEWYKNGVKYNRTYTQDVADSYLPRISLAAGQDVRTNFGQNPTFSGNTTAGTFTDSNGKGLFKYQPPSGFLALCEDNLPTPAISDPGKYFKTVLWTGDGNSGRSIVGVGFTPDLVWIKNRVRASDHILQDSVRGFGPVTKLASSSTQKENDTTSGGSYGITDPQWGYLTSANYDGFSLAVSSGGGFDQANKSTGDTYTAWCWRAGGAAVSNNAGTIASQVSVNQDAGFSIVSYTGNGSTGTVGHGLGKAPKFIIYKHRESGVRNWLVDIGPITGTTGDYLYLNSTQAKLNSVNVLGATSSVLNLGNTPESNEAYKFIAYCWAEIEGFSKFGIYSTNSSTDGPFVYLGFKPAFLLVKPTYVSNWIIMDSSRGPVNPDLGWLYPDGNFVEDKGSSRYCDFLSNGFKVRNGGTGMNNGGSVIFAAFAESPFTTANAK